ncbi:MAG: hypothetical protein ACXWWU_04725 [Candidatus Limnocylindria bacterium]
MTSPCIHGFRPEQCAACRTCPHGLVTSQCGRCIKASSTPALRKAAITTHGHHPSEERGGFEIVYVPALNGWQIQSDGEPTSPESYRSLFLARKAAERMAAEPTPAGSKGRG